MTDISAKLDEFISKTNPTKTVEDFYISIADLHHCAF
jgi:hypothetical protein